MSEKAKSSAGSILDALEPAAREFMKKSAAAEPSIAATAAPGTALRPALRGELQFERIRGTERRSWH